MNKRLYKVFLPGLLLPLLLSSCLSDTNINDQEYGLINLNSKKIVEIATDASHTRNIISLDLGKTDFDFELRLAAENPAAEDIEVKLEVVKDTAAVRSAVRTYLGDQYPATGKDSVPDEDLVPFDFAGASVPATIVIPKGSRSVKLPVNIDTHLLKSETQFALFRIKSVTNSGYTVSGNFGQVLLSLKVKHKYAGRYVLTGTNTDLANASFKHITVGFAALHPNEPYTVQLQTYDGQSLVLWDELVWEDYLYPMTNGSALSGYGQFCPIFTFDANDNIVAVTNYYPNATNTRKAAIDPSGVNKYDPTTKSFTVSYFMLQPSVVAAAPNIRCKIVETYKLVEE
ncbi:MAG: hypothetical protein RIS29_1857 [Bacteroidota bacterium]|jgi:hypothetical protein